jgi:hypothetical protein
VLGKAGKKNIKKATHLAICAFLRAIENKIEKYSIKLVINPVQKKARKTECTILKCYDIVKLALQHSFFLQTSHQLAHNFVALNTHHTLALNDLQCPSFGNKWAYNQDFTFRMG